MREIYYTVFFDTYDGMEKNGLFDIRMYEIVDNRPIIIGMATGNNEDYEESDEGFEECIHDWLCENVGHDFREDDEIVEYKAIEL